MTNINASTRMGDLLAACPPGYMPTVISVRANGVSTSRIYFKQTTKAVKQ